MAICAEGHEWRTVLNPLYVNNERVRQVFVGKKQVYPDYLEKYFNTEMELYGILEFDLGDGKPLKSEMLITANIVTRGYAPVFFAGAKRLMDDDFDEMGNAHRMEPESPLFIALRFASFKEVDNPSDGYSPTGRYSGIHGLHYSGKAVDCIADTHIQGNLVHAKLVNAGMRVDENYYNPMPFNTNKPYIDELGRFHNDPSPGAYCMPYVVYQAYQKIVKELENLKYGIPIRFHEETRSFTDGYEPLRGVFGLCVRRGGKYEVSDLPKGEKRSYTMSIMMHDDYFGDYFESQFGSPFSDADMKYVKNCLQGGDFALYRGSSIYMNVPFSLPSSSNRYDIRTFRLAKCDVTRVRRANYTGDGVYAELTTGVKKGGGNDPYEALKETMFAR